MTINIKFELTSKKYDKTKLFSGIGKTLTAISAPIFLATAYASITGDDASIGNAAVAGHGHKEKPVIPHSMLFLMSAIMAAYGSNFKRRAVVEANDRALYAGDADNLTALLASIEEEKAKLIERWAEDESDGWFREIARSGRYMSLPRLNLLPQSHLYLFMNEDEIEKLDPIRQLTAYHVQNRFLSRVMGLRGYEPNVPEAYSNFGETAAPYSVLKSACRADNAALKEKLEKEYKVDMVVAEHWEREKVREMADRKIDRPGCATYAGAVFFPGLVAAYQNLNAMYNNFTRDNALKDHKPTHEDVHVEMEKLTREMCGINDSYLRTKMSENRHLRMFMDVDPK